MRALLLTLCLLFSLIQQTYAQDKALNGYWILEHIDLPDSSIWPEYGRFYLEVDEKNILFNLEKNKCGMTAKIENNKISDCYGGCTKICCDDWYGNTSSFFDINCTYQIIKDTLIMTNRWGKLHYLKSSKPLD